MPIRDVCKDDVNFVTRTDLGQFSIHLIIPYAILS
jgi:hypothetical protein